MRTANRIASSLLAAVLLFGGLLVVAESIAVGLGQPPLLLPLSGIYDALTAMTVGGTAWLVVSIVVTVLGVVTLAAQLRPWRPIRLRLAEGTGDWYVGRRHLEQRIGSAIANLSTVTAASVGATKRWRLTVSATADPSEREAVTSTVNSELDRIGAPTTRRVRVRLRRPRRVV